MFLKVHFERSIPGKCFFLFSNIGNISKDRWWTGGFSISVNICTPTNQILLLRISKNLQISEIFQIFNFETPKYNKWLSDILTNTKFNSQ